MLLLAVQHSYSYMYLLLVNYKAEALKKILRWALIIPEKSIPEKRVLYVRCKHCGLPGFGFPGWMQTSQKEDVHTRGTSAHAHNNNIVILCKRLKFTDGCSEELTIYFAALFWLFSKLTNSKRFGAIKANHRLNRKFVQTDDTTQDSEETATAFTVSQSSHNSNKALVWSTNQNPRERG